MLNPPLVESTTNNFFILMHENKLSATSKEPAENLQKYITNTEVLSSCSTFVFFLETLVYFKICVFILFLHFHLQCSLPESNVSGDQPPLSLGSTDEGSWIQVDENEAQPTLWVPDHAATNCAKCDTQFWIANRKHHCRYYFVGFCCHRISATLLGLLTQNRAGGGYLVCVTSRV